ncbi:GNAT family N-acetyltransferase [Myxosarcina sp. GI1]|uniref:GNAT family N-acetyltransferase n=1 Tax=Myxosarcina sp. GI1 TaxID=1541065 RepID=UPI000559CC87|nr:GNAT family N-acetyltransferase [Myxosarcina sp. GI1]
MDKIYGEFRVRDWQQRDRDSAARVIRQVLSEYGLPWQPEDADRDAVEVEASYLATGGEFWVVERANKIVGTAGYYPTTRGEKAVEIRKMYLLPEVRGRGLGKYLLRELETAIMRRNYAQIWLETATVLVEAVKLYQSFGYQPATGIETERCDLVYVKKLSINNKP